MLKVLATTCVSLAIWSGPVVAMEILSHQAGYDVTLAKASSRSVVSAVSGQIGYGVQHTCDGWLTQQSGTMNMHLPSGDVLPQIMQFSSLENGNGYRFSFTVDGVEKQTIFGRAEMTDATGTATFSRPEKQTFVLPKNTRFPVNHTNYLLAGAMAGKDQLQSLVFEGTELQGAKLLVAFVSPLSTQSEAITKSVGGSLLNRPGWNFRLAYFDPDDRTGVPEYEVEVDLLDNGVATRWVLDYGSFSVEMKLAKVEEVATPSC